MKISFKYLIVFLVLTIIVRSQNRQTDSLRLALMTAETKDLHDTVKIRMMVNLSWELVYSDPDSAIRLTTRAEKIALRSNFRKHEGLCYHALGWFYDVKSEYKTSLENYDKAIAVWKEYSMVRNEAATLTNIGSVYASLGDFPKALDHYLRSQLSYEKLGLNEEIAIGNNNIGLIYFEKGDYKKALTYYFKALKVFKEVKHKNGEQSALANIGSAYSNLKDLEKAIQYTEEALKISEKLGDKIGNSANLGNLGLVYHDSDPQKALLYYQKALSIALETGDKGNIAAWQGNIGELNLKNKNYSEAEKYLSSALKIFEEIKDMDGQMEAQGQLSELYDKTDRDELALKHYKRYGALKDTIFNLEKEKAITFREMNYEFDKKQFIANAIHDKVMVAVEDQKKKQLLIIWLAGIGIVVVIIFLVFVFRSLRIARKQKDIIAKQKELVEEKQKEVLSSIHYAYKIQKALLPSERYIERNLKHFKN